MNDTVALPKAMYFDWDGTLVDSYEFLKSAHNNVKAQLGLEPFADDEFRYYFGKPREYIYETVYGDQAAKAWELFDIYVQAHHATELKAMDRAQNLLETLVDLNIVCGVVTNKRASLVRAEVEFYGWAEHFATVVGAGEAAEDKPSDAPLRLALSQSGDFAAQDIWFIGDSEADAACAQKFGCPFILIHETPESLEWFKKYTALHSFKTCAAMHDFMLQNSGKSLKQ